MSRASRSRGTPAFSIPTKGKPNFTGSFAEAEPVVYSGTMYMPDSKGNVFAFDAVTGERLWYYKPKYPKNFAAGLPTSRGVVIGDGKVFMAQTDASVVGLDQSTGRVAWKTVIGNYKLGYFFTSPPTYVNGMLIVGTSGGDFGARCKVVAIDGKTGKIKWTYYVIPTGKQFGAQHVAEAPGLPRRRRRLGTARRRPGPRPRLRRRRVTRSRTTATSRGKGKELFTESVVALNMNTGKYRWHYQDGPPRHLGLRHGGQPARRLRSRRSRGRPRKAIASMGKTGWIYMLDRTNGKPILGINEKKVPQSRGAAHVPDPADPGRPALRGAVRPGRPGRSGRLRTASR